MIKILGIKDIFNAFLEYILSSGQN